jgi:hypothetical protein
MAAVRAPKNSPSPNNAANASLCQCLPSKFFMSCKLGRVPEPPSLNHRHDVNARKFILHSFPLHAKFFHMCKCLSLHKNFLQVILSIGMRCTLELCVRKKIQRARTLVK